MSAVFVCTLAGIPSTQDPITSCPSDVSTSSVCIHTLTHGVLMAQSLLSIPGLFLVAEITWQYKGFHRYQMWAKVVFPIGSCLQLKR